MVVPEAGYTPNAEFTRLLKRAHERCVAPCALRSASEKFVEGLLAVLFPHLNPSECPEQCDPDARLRDLELMLRSLVAMANPVVSAEDVSVRYFEALPSVHAKLLLDAEAIEAADPAAESLDEVVLAYPGFYAIAVYRLAHELDLLGVPLLPRLLAEYAHRETGIDIHPGAVIGCPFVIDHGTGLVIGQTTEIGDNVTMYQGVTLGALHVSKKMSSSKRHPTIEDDVVIYAGATILGGKTRVGAGSIIGGNVWLTESVPPGSVVTHRHELKIRTPDDVAGQEQEKI